MASTSTHFTANIAVSRVVQNTEDVKRNNSMVVKSVKSDREVHEVAKVVVRAESLEVLRDKIRAHVSLIDDESEGE